MTYKASDKFTPYDWWFDKNVPKAQYGSLQCWLYKEIIPEIVKFVEVNQPILSEWVLDQWVEDRNLGRVQLWEGDWKVIPMPLNVVGLSLIHI